MTGNTRTPNVYYVWKEQENLPEYISQHDACVGYVKRQAKVYATRSMLFKAGGIISTIGALTGKGFKVIFEQLTGMCVPQEHKDDRCVRWSLPCVSCVGVHDSHKVIDPKRIAITYRSAPTQGALGPHPTRSRGRHLHLWAALP